MSDQSHVDDHTFLRELIRLTDARPTEFVTGRDVADALSVAKRDLEPNIMRLRNRGLIERVPGVPQRMGDNRTSWPLRPTLAGYRHDDTGLNR